MVQVISRPTYQQARLEQIAYALGIAPDLLGLPQPSPFEVAEHRFNVRCEQLCTAWRITPREFDRNMSDRKMGSSA